MKNTTYKEHLQRAILEILSRSTKTSVIHVSENRAQEKYLNGYCFLKVRVGGLNFFPGEGPTSPPLVLPIKDERKKIK